jgi:hypothetical protein
LLGGVGSAAAVPFLTSTPSLTSLHALLHHPLAAVTPQAARPTIQGLDLRLTGCAPGDIHLDRLAVLAGLLRQVRNKKGATKDIGIPGGVRIEMRGANATAVPKECVWSLPFKTRAAAVRTFKRGGCATCAACLDALGFKCGASYRVRVQAKGRGTKLLDSEWSREVVWKPACTAPAGVECYSCAFGGCGPL